MEERRLGVMEGNEWPTWTDQWRRTKGSSAPDQLVQVAHLTVPLDEAFLILRRYQEEQEREAADLRTGPGTNVEGGSQICRGRPRTGWQPSCKLRFTPGSWWPASILSPCCSPVGY